jgi:PAS domain S-box-containing protein
MPENNETGHLLCIGDDELLLADVKSTLENYGYRVDIANSGALGLKKAASTQYDAVVLELRMREMDGLAVLDAVKDLDDLLPVIVVSVVDDVSRILEVVRLGAFDVVPRASGELTQLAATLKRAVAYSRMIRSSRARSASVQRLATLVHAMGDALIDVDRDGKIRDWNPAAEKMFGYSRSDLVEMSLLRLTPMEEREQHTAIRTVLTEERVVSEIETVCLAKGGRRLDIAMSLWPQRDERGDGDGAWALLRNITEQKQMRAELANTERLSSLGTLVAGLGHEINNPLTYVRTNLRFLNDSIQAILGGISKGRLKGADVDALEEFEQQLSLLLEAMEDAKTGTDRIGAIVRRLRAFTSRSDATLRLIAVEPILEAALDLAGNELHHRVKVVRRYSPVAKILADEGQLVQAVLNLLLNAAQAFKRGDSSTNTVSVSTRMQTPGWIAIEIEDTGCGVPPKLRDKIFDPFVTAKSDQRGLGLSVCLRIVQDHGGSIHFSDRDEQGTRVTILLPAGEARKAAAVPVKRERPKKRPRILIIDDDKLVGRALVRALSRQYEVDFAEGGQVGLDKLRQKEGYSVVLCDLQMPKVSGWQIHEELRAAGNPHLDRIVFMTGGAFTDAAAEFLETVKPRCLSKPLDRAELLQGIEQVLNRL